MSTLSPEADSIHPQEFKDELVNTGRVVKVWDEAENRQTIVIGVRDANGNGKLVIKGGDGNLHKITPEYAAGFRLQLNLTRRLEKTSSNGQK